MVTLEINKQMRVQIKIYYKKQANETDVVMDMTKTLSLVKIEL